MRRGYVGWRSLTAQQALDYTLKDYWETRGAGDMPWPEVGVGAASGLALLPAVVALFYVVLGVPFLLVGGGGSRPEVAEVLLTAPMAIFAALVAGGALFLVTAFAAAVTLCVLSVSLHLLGIRSRLTPVTAFAGGVIALVATSPLWLTAAFEGPNRAQLTMPFALAIATGAGQLGGVLLATNNESIPWAKRGKTERAKPAEPISFSMRQVFALMLIVSVGLAVLQAAGLLHPAVLMVVGVWSIIQYGTLRLVVAFADRQHRKLIRRLTEACEPAVDGGKETESASADTCGVV